MKRIILLISLPIAICLNASVESGHHDHACQSHSSHSHAPARDENKAGPNGGRIIASVEPRLEFLVTPDRKVQITFLDHHGEAIPAGEQQISLIGGSRANPARLSFERKGSVLLSTQALPDAKVIPVILTIKVTPESKAIRERLNVNLSQCPSCEYLEYACVCSHE